MTGYRSFFLEHGHRLRSADLHADVPGKRANPGWDECPFRVLIVRLSPWRDVEQSTPHHFLEGAVRRSCPGAFVDYAFFPQGCDLRLLKEHGVPLLTGIAGFHGAAEFDLLLVSVSYVLELPNLPLLLSGSGLPLYSGERGERDPIVILGGSSAYASQSVVARSGDMFPDAIFFGEGEGEVERLVSRLFEKRGASRSERLSVLADFPCILTAGSGRDSSKPVAANRCGTESPGEPSADERLFASTMLNGSEAGTVRLQISRGCPSFCTFCFESYDRKPYRELPAETILRGAKELKLATGADTLELYSFNFNTHESILPLLLELNKIFLRVNYMSQRLDYLGSVSGLMEAEIRAGKRSFTLGVEGISGRIRTLYQKNFESRELDGVLGRLHEMKARELKLFYVLSGYETEEDLEEFRQFLKRLKTLRQSSQSAPRIVFSFNLLTRMPGTPLRYDRLFLDPDGWKTIASEAKCAVETHGFEYRLSTRFEEYALAQVLALGGEFTHDLLAELHERGMFFDQYMPEEAWDVAKDVLSRSGVPETGFYEEKDESWSFPFENVRTGVSKEFLYRTWRLSKRGKRLPTCLGSGCIGCDACADAEERSTLSEHAVEPPEGGTAAYLSRLAALMGEKAKAVPVNVLLDVPPALAHAVHAYRNAWVARELFRLIPGTADIVYSVQESYFSRKENLYRYPGWYGTGFFAVHASDPERFRSLVRDSGGTALNVRLLPPERNPSRRDGEPEVSLLRGELHANGLILPDADLLFERYLREIHLPFSVRKTGDGRKALELSDKAKKKRVLADARIDKTGTDVRISFEGTSKFSPAEIPGPGDRALVRALSLEVKELRLREE